MKKLKGGIPTCHQQTLDEEDLIYLMKIFSTGLYDDCLFLAILLTCFYRLMCVGKLTQLDMKVKWSLLKSALSHSLKFLDHGFSFHLPYHKGDRLFDGNTIMIEAHPGSLI